ncbi:DUF262 domain-containing protein [Ornithinimicrobium panacihumi]|uniref:DUF262 domain-containing protein n=1 Tax=Ornithinimicrobium panacihumi TaxID=2008449 RepID=UPI003F8B3B74
MVGQQELTLQSVASERLFRIPDYQRPYAWERKQLEDLWSDLNLMTSNRHYAGTLVLQPTGGEPAITSSGMSLELCDVVDGQQRLTTCFILLDQLRRRLEDFDDEDANEIARNLRNTFGYVSIGGVKRPKLELGSELKHYWANSVLGDEPAAVSSLIVGQRRLKEAREFFAGRLQELTDGVDSAAAVQRLQLLNARVVSGLRFLVYDVSDKSDVGVIFETLNERGRTLSDTDKIKNYLLYLARGLPSQRRDDLVQHINQVWAEIFRNHSTMSGNPEDSILRAHWLATVDPRSREWRRTASVKIQFPRSRYIPSSQTLTGAPASGDHDADRLDELVKDIKTYVDTLQRCSLFAAELAAVSPNFVDFSDNGTRAAEAQAALRRTGTLTFFYPLLFATRLRHPQDGELYARVLRACETFAARVFVIGQRRSNAGAQILYYLAHEVFKGLDPQKALVEINAATWKYGNDERVRGALGAAEDWYNRRGHKYFLYEYEISLLSSSAQKTLLPFDSFTSKAYSETTEHILPQTLAGQWKNDFTKAQHEQLRHSLGNLMLTHTNSTYSNKDYRDKRGQPTSPAGFYYGAAMAQEREVAKSYDEWTPESILERQEHLAAWAMQRWPATPPATGDVSEMEDAVPDAIEMEGEDLDGQTEDEEELS